MSEITERVASGAAWLDEQRPDWWHAVNLGRLDMTSECLCVLGQVFAQVALVSEDADGFEFDNGYDYADRELGAPMIEGGFYIRVDWNLPDAANETNLRYAELDAEWKRLIAERRAAA